MDTYEFPILELPDDLQYSVLNENLPLLANYVISHKNVDIDTVRKI